MIEDHTLFKYDLAQNYLYGQGLRTLKYYCIFSMVKMIFSKRKIIDQIMCLNLDKISESEVYEHWKLIVEDVKKIVSIWLSSDIVSSSVRQVVSSLVREVVSFTEKEIYIFLLKHYANFDYRLFLTNFVYTSQGTINTYKTVLKILQNEKRLSKELRFEIASHYFISKDLIKLYLNDLPESSRRKYSSSDNILQLKDPSPTLWCWFFNINKEQLNNLFSVICTDELNTELNSDSNNGIDDSINKPLNVLLDEKGLFRDNDVFQVGLKWALNSSNEIALQYFWELFKVSRQNRIEILSNFFQCVFASSSSGKVINIYMYLYFETIDKNPKNLCSNINFFIKKTIIFHRWQCLFSKTLKFYEQNLSHQDYFKIFKNIVDELCEFLRMKQSTDSQENMLKEFLMFISSSTKDALASDMLLYLSTSFNKFLEEKDIESAKYLLLMEKYPDTIKAFTHCNSDLFLSSLKSGEFDFIDQCLEQFSSSSETVSSLKRTLFLRNAKTLFHIFIDEMLWDNLTSLIYWGSLVCHVNEIIQIKTSIPFDSNGKVIRKILFNPSSNVYDIQFNYAEKVLFWCLGDESLVLTYKKNSILSNTSARLFTAPPVVDFYQEIIKLIINKKWRFINELFCWASCSDEEVKAVKHKLKEDESFLKILCQVKDIKIIKIFPYWCESEEENINELKRKLLLMYYDYVQEIIRKRR